jgi:hypothetical protein
MGLLIAKNTSLGRQTVENLMTTTTNLFPGGDDTNHLTKALLENV